LAGTGSGAPGGDPLSMMISRVTSNMAKSSDVR
jgi:hypothetical protein